MKTPYHPLAKFAIDIAKRDGIVDHPTLIPALSGATWAQKINSRAYNGVAKDILATLVEQDIMYRCNTGTGHRLVGQEINPTTLERIGAIAQQALDERDLGADYLADMLQDVIKLAEQGYRSNAETVG